MGIGQKSPFLLAMRQDSQQPRQSSRPMKPSRGVNAPIPIMMRPPVSRLVIGTRFRRSALRISFATLEEPFNADDIVALVNRITVETLEAETA